MPSVFTTLIKYIRDLPMRTTPLDSDMIPCAGVDGHTYHTTRGALRTDIPLPAGHAASHQHGGLDEVATATPAPNAIPKATSGSKLDGWISSASVSTLGLVELATDGETSAGVVVQGNDARLGKITPGVPQTLGNTYIDLQEVAANTFGDPASEHKRLFLDFESGLLSVKGTSGLAIPLEPAITVSPTGEGDAIVNKLSADDSTGIGLVRIGDTGEFYGIDATESTPGVVTLATPSSDITAGHVVQANDARLSDARTPTSHSHSGADITSGTVAAARLPDATTSTKGIVELATNGESASGVVVQGNDERLLKIIRKSTLTSVSGSSAVTADPELTRSVVAGSTYYFRLVIHVDDVGATGITYSLDGTATYSHIRYQTYAVGNVSWGLLNADRVTGIGITSQAVGDTFYCVYIDGSCVVTGSGTMEFNWGPSSVVIDDVSVLEGSTFELTLAMA